MKPVHVFLGPTLPVADARLIMPEATFLGPAGQGDLYRTCQQKPAAILIIDGVFEQQLAVWHKEILWALAHGIRVYGAASMGALRAAELAAFGMVGVGSIFEGYADGTIEDDDEVAVVHENADHGYRSLSQAMVNIRATLARALQAGVISTALADRLSRDAKAAFYPDRKLLRFMAAAQDSHPEMSRLASWLEGLRGGQIDQKRLDAEAALRRLVDDTPTFARPSPPGFRFQYTEAWHEFRRIAGRGRDAG